MNKKIFVIFIVLILIFSLSLLFMYDKSIIDKEKENNEEILDVLIETEGNFSNEEKSETEESDILGTLKIEKIDIIGEIKEGTTEEILENYIGHIEETAKYDGNIGLAAHNRGNKYSYFSRINELEIGDEITYQSKYGNRTYIVCDKQEILETDWSYLRNTKENKLTLITCIRNKVNQRLCVQAIQKNV